MTKYMYMYRFRSLVTMQLNLNARRNALVLLKIQQIVYVISC